MTLFSKNFLRLNNNWRVKWSSAPEVQTRFSARNSFSFPGSRCFGHVAVTLDKGGFINITIKGLSEDSEGLKEKSRYKIIYKRESFADFKNKSCTIFVPETKIIFSLTEKISYQKFAENFNNLCMRPAVPYKNNQNFVCWRTLF